MIDSDFIFLLLIDNNNMIVISKDKKITHNACHIEIHYHHIWDLIEKVIIDVVHILSAQMAADDFTKFLDAIKFDEFRDLIGIEDCEWKFKTASMLAMRKTLYNNYFTFNLAKIVLEYITNFVCRFQPLSHAHDE